MPSLDIIGKRSHHSRCVARFDFGLGFHDVLLLLAQFDIVGLTDVMMQSVNLPALVFVLTFIASSCVVLVLHPFNCRSRARG